MVETNLIFFSNLHDSWDGLQRGFVAFLFLMLFDLTWFRISSVTRLYDGVITRPKVSIAAVLVTWIILASALGVQQNPAVWSESMIYGALVGFVAYGVYNGSNYATLKTWSTKIALTDTIWGSTACSVSSLMLFYIFHQPKNLKKTV